MKSTALGQFVFLMVFAIAVVTLEVIWIPVVESRWPNMPLLVHMAPIFLVVSVALVAIIWKHHSKKQN